MKAIGYTMAASALLSWTSHSAVIAEPVKKPFKLEGMDYRAARKAILAYGWKPLEGDCGGGGTDSSTCAAYPEIGNCSGTGVGFCDMTFVKGARCLIVVTVGGAPQATLRRGPIVRDVQFRRGPCSKD